MDAALPTATKAALSELWSFGRAAALELHLVGSFPPRQSSSQRAVILIPGCTGSPRYLADLANSLHEMAPLYTVSYEPDDTDDGVEALKRTLADIPDSQKSNGVDLIGHSQGAAIACEYAFVEKPDIPVHRVISLGGRLRPIGCGKWLCYRRLAPHLKEIDRVDKPTLYTIAASHDWLVPMGAVHVVPKERQFTVWGASHASLVFDPTTWEILSKLLRVSN